MDHLANSITELRQGGKGWYVGWQGICIIDLGENVVFKSGNLSVWKWMYSKYVSWKPSITGEVPYWDAGSATRLYVTLYSITRRLSMRLCSRERQFRSFSIVTLEVKL